MYPKSSKIPLGKKVIHVFVKYIFFDCGMTNNSITNENGL